MKFVLTLSIVLFFGAISFAQVWDGGGITNLWSEAANWDTNTVPGDNDDVIISGAITGGDITVVVSLSDSCRSIQLIPRDANGSDVNLIINTGARLGVELDVTLDDRNRNTCTNIISIAGGGWLNIGRDAILNKNNGNQGLNHMYVELQDDNSRMDVGGVLDMTCTSGNNNNIFGIFMTEDSEVNANSVSVSLNDDIQGSDLLSMNDGGVLGDAAQFNVTTDFDLLVDGDDYDITFDLDFNALLNIDGDFNISSNNTNQNGRNFRFQLDGDSRIDVAGDWDMDVRPKSNGDIEFHLNQTSAGVTTDAQILVGGNCTWRNTGDNSAQFLDIFMSENSLIDVEGDFIVDQDGSGDNEDLRVTLNDDAIIDVEGDLSFEVNDGNNVDFILDMNDQSQILAGNDPTDILNIDMLNGCGRLTVSLDNDALIQSSGNLEIDYDGDLDVDIDLNQNAAGTGADAQIICGGDFRYTAVDGDNFDLRLSENSGLSVAGNFTYNASNLDGGNNQVFTLNDDASLDIEGSASFTLNTGNNADLRFDFDDNSSFDVGVGIVGDLSITTQNGPGEVDIELDADAQINVANDFSMVLDSDEPYRIHLNENAAGTSGTQFNVGGNTNIDQNDGDDFEFFLSDGASYTSGGDFDFDGSNQDGNGQDFQIVMNDDATFDVDGHFRANINDGNDIDILFDFHGNSQFNSGTLITDSTYLHITDGTDINIFLDDDASMTTAGKLTLHQEDTDDADEIQLFLNRNTAGTNGSRLMVGSDLWLLENNDGGEIEFSIDFDGEVTVGGDLYTYKNGNNETHIHLNRNNAGTGTDAALNISGDMDINMVDGDRSEIYLADGANLNVLGNVDWSGVDIDDNNDDMELDMLDNSTFDVDGSFNMSINDGNDIDLRIDMQDNTALNVGTNTTHDFIMNLIDGTDILIQLDDDAEINAAGDVNLIQNDIDDGDEIIVRLNGGTNNGTTSSRFNIGGDFNYDMQNNAGEVELILDYDAQMDITGDLNILQNGVDELMIYLNRNNPGVLADAQLSVGGDVTLTKQDGDQGQVFLSDGSDFNVGGDFTWTATNIDDNGDDQRFNLTDESTIDVDGSVFFSINDDSDIDLRIEMDSSSTFNIGSNANDSLFMNVIDGTLAIVTMDDDAVMNVTGKLSMLMTDNDNSDQLLVLLNENTNTGLTSARLNVSGDLWMLTPNLASEQEIRINYDGEITIGNDLYLYHAGNDDIHILLNQANPGVGTDALLSVGGDFDIVKVAGDETDVRLSADSRFLVAGDMNWDISNIDDNDDDHEIRLRENASMDIDGSINVTLNDDNNIDFEIDGEGTSDFIVGTNPTDNLTMNMIDGADLELTFEEDATFTSSGDVIFNQSGDEDVILQANQNLAGSGTDVQINIGGDLIINKDDGDNIFIRGSEHSDIAVAGDLDIQTSNTDADGEDLIIRFRDDATMQLDGNSTIALNEVAGLLIDVDIDAAENASINFDGNLDIDFSNAEDMEIDLANNSSFSVGGNFTFDNSVDSRGWYLDMDNDANFSVGGNLEITNLSILNTPTRSEFIIDNDAVMSITGNLNLVHTGEDDVLFHLNQNAAGTALDARISIGGNFTVDKEDGDHLRLFMDENSSLNVGGDLDWNYDFSAQNNDDMQWRIRDDATIEILGSATLTWNNSIGTTAEPFTFDMDNNAVLNVGPSGGPFNTESLTFNIQDGSDHNFSMDNEAEINVYGNLVINKTGADDHTFVLNGNAGTGAEIHVENDFVINNADDDEKITIELNQTSLLDVNGDINMTSTLSANKVELELNNDSKIELEGNFSRNAGATQFGILDCNDNSTVEYNGQNNSQFFSEDAGAGGDSFDYQNVIINNSFGTNPQLTMEGLATVHGSINFTDGVISSNAADILVIDNGASTTGASDASHVDGFVRKIGNTPAADFTDGPTGDSYAFPVGDDDNYQPCFISNTGSAASSFEAQYIEVDPHPTYDENSKEPTVHHISSCEYWLIERNTAENVRVALSWDANSCGVTNLTSLLVARWDGSMWRDEGNGGTNGTTASGEIASGALVTNFSPFTLASTGTSNPLPIELVDFQARKSEEKVILDWSTASEINNNHFIVERSADGQLFEPILEKDAVGNSSVLVNYQDFDFTPLIGLNYYRLKQVDFDGSYSYSDVRTVEFDDRSGLDFDIFPNPNNGHEISLNLPEMKADFMIRIFDAQGKIIQTFQYEKNAAQVVQINNLELSTGMYFVNLSNESSNSTKKLIVE